MLPEDLPQLQKLHMGREDGGGGITPFGEALGSCLEAGLTQQVYHVYCVLQYRVNTEEAL